MRFMILQSGAPHPSGPELDSAVTNASAHHKPVARTNSTLFGSANVA